MSKDGPGKNIFMKTRLHLLKLSFALALALTPAAQGDDATPLPDSIPGAPAPLPATPAPAPTGAVEDLKRASAVFVGEVLNVRSYNEYVYHVTFRVHRAWKGSGTAKETIITPLLDGMCGYPFRTGEKYLVFAYGKNPATSLCTRTKLLTDAARDLEELGLPRFINDRVVR